MCSNHLRRAALDERPRMCVILSHTLYFLLSRIDDLEAKQVSANFPGLPSDVSVHQGFLNCFRAHWPTFSPLIYDWITTTYPDFTLVRMIQVEIILRLESSIFMQFLSVGSSLSLVMMCSVFCWPGLVESRFRR